MSHQLFYLFRILIANLYNAINIKQSRLFTLGILFYLLSEPVFVSCGHHAHPPANLQIKKLTKIPTKYRVSATSEETVVLEYPWNPRHDRRPGRQNHQDWRTGMAHAYCMHLNPGHYPPFLHPNETLGRMCASWLHDHEDGRSKHLPCHSSLDDDPNIIRPNGRRTWPAHRTYAKLEEWENFEQVDSMGYSSHTNPLN